MSVDIDATPDLLLLIQQKLCMGCTDAVVFPRSVIWLRGSEKLIASDRHYETIKPDTKVLVRHYWQCDCSKGYQASLCAPDTSVEFQHVNSRICVAMMVFAPIYVVQM